MKRLEFASRARKAFGGRSRGFTLIEIVIAIALLGMISVAVMTSLSYATTVLIIADRRASAESLARSQMEFVKNSPYIDYSLDLSDDDRDPDFYLQITVPSEVGDYTLLTQAEPIDPSDHQPYSGENGVYQEDDGIQRITVTVSYYVVRYDVTSQNRTFVAQNFTLEDYKINPDMELEI